MMTGFKRKKVYQIKKQKRRLYEKNKWVQSIPGRDREKAKKLRKEIEERREEIKNNKIISHSDIWQ